MGLAINRVHQGDCVEKLGELQPGSVDLVFADPPFNIGYKYDIYDDSRPAPEFLTWCEKWMAGVERVLKPDGTFWLAIGDEFAAELKVAAQQIGFRCRSWVVWYYTFGVNCTRAFSRSHTHLFHFVKDLEQFTFNAQHPAIRVPSARELVYADGRANPKGRLPDNTWVLRPQDASGDCFLPDHDTWYYSRVAGTFKEREGFHGCQMPEQLLGRIIRVSSNPDDLVLDPFTGSGTTLAVSKKLGRRYLGFELSTDYVKRITSRLADINVGDSLDGPADPAGSSPKTTNGRRLKRAKSSEERKRFETAVVGAFEETSEGRSVDYLLSHPEMNQTFVKACRKAGLPRQASLLNKTLLQVRKSGQLPRAKDRGKRLLSFRQMDAFSFASEIAMEYVCREYTMTLDEVFCEPARAEQFDKLAEKFAPGHTPLEYRWAAFAIRKRAKKGHKLADDSYSDWSDRELPRSIPVKRLAPESFEGPGCYVVSLRGAQRPIYSGETLDLSSRLQNLVATDAWLSMGQLSVRVIGDVEHPSGLQSALVQRFRPQLNSHLLVPTELRRNGDTGPGRGSPRRNDLIATS